MASMDVDDGGGLPQAISSLKESVSISASIREEELDELRYSRVIYTLGRDAFQSLHRSRVLILGCSAVGVEVAKNLALSGVRGIGLVDSALVSQADLGASFLLRQQNVGQRRSLAVAHWLKQVNGDMEVVTLEPAVDAYASVIASYDAVVVTSGTSDYHVNVNKVCREAHVPFVLAVARGVFLSVFTDFGQSFTVVDETGEPGEPVLVESVTQDFPATVTVVEEQRHGLEEGDEVVFEGIQGMLELNGRAPFTVNVTGTSSFTIPEDTRNYERYVSGGRFRKLKRVKTHSFLSLEESLLRPEFCITDPVKASRAPQLHVSFQAVDEYLSRNGGSSQGGSSPLEEQDVEEILAIARERWKQSPLSALVTLANNGNSAMDVTSAALEGRSVDPGNFGDLTGVMGDEGRVQRAAETSTSGDQQIGHDEEMVRRGERNRAEINEHLVRLVAQGAKVELSPVAAIAGGLAAHEVIKGISGVLVPIHQWLYFDAVECLPTHLGKQSVSPLDNGSVDPRYEQQVILFGEMFQRELGSLKWLVVGAGGIGCEVLKNLVLMGVGCNPDGSVTVTDMDSVARPNLVDQVLYQVGDISRPKTPTAGRALRAINPSAQIHVLQEKFDSTTEDVFDSSFLDSLSGVFCAVDTSESRIYIDARCVSKRKPMIDGGKHGAKGSVQVFVPFQSEMYASTRDPPEHKEIPICTLKNFPYATEHTLRWAIDTFEALFKQRPIDVNTYLSSRDFLSSNRKLPSDTRLAVLETLRDALVRRRPLSFESCIEWARLQFEDLFVNNIRQLCFNFPRGMSTTAGAPFWSGTKRVPDPVPFDPSDTLHIDFIIAAANLQATVYGLKGYEDRQLFIDSVQRVEVPSFVPKEGVRIATSDNELRTAGRRFREDSDASDACELILGELPTPATLAGYRLTPIEFEKDAEQSFHAEFVAAASSLRARNYGIPSADKLQARLVGGRVIPALVTSTSVVGGLMCLELYKLVQGKPLAYHKHSYFNLSVPFFSHAEPRKAVQFQVMRKGKPPLIWTLWDRFEMDCVGKTLESFLEDFKREQGLEITMISYGKSLLYAEFLPKKKLQDRLPLQLLELITSVSKVTVPPTESTVCFGLSCTDANEQDVEVPDLIARVR